MPFSYANPTSGPSAGGIGWFNFGTLTMNPGDTIPGLTGVLNDGTTVTFDLALSLVSGTGRPYVATQPPTFATANFGVTGYTGIVGNVVMQGDLAAPTGTSLFTISNVTLTNPDSTPVTNYTVVFADAERTNTEEQLILQSTGGGWQLFTTLGSGTNPTLTGLNTQTATITGNTFAVSNAYVLTTQSPTQLDFTIQNGIDSRQAFALGFATTRVHLQKNIAGRIDPADQFVLNIGGTPSATATTAGATTGIQTQTADLFATPGSTYNISEAMAPGSVSTLTDYTQTVSAGNATPAGSVPPTGALPIAFTPSLGDDVTYTILNVAPAVFTKTVDKAFADIGEILTYTISVKNPDNFALSNVLVTDATPAGTTYIGNITASEAYTGTDLASGITFTTIPANTTATISWQVQVNSLPPIPIPVANVGTVNVPGGTSGNTNAVTTQINTAFVNVNKMTDKAFANVGDIVTYTLMLMNAGNVSANNVVVTDAIPAGTTFVPGSVTGATGTPPNLTLTAPIAPGATSTVTFQVQIDSIPSPNPIPNTASAAFTYTVNPAEPNGASGSATSNTPVTQVNSAIVSTVKTAVPAFAAPGDTITYTLVLTNDGNVPADNVVITDAIPNGTTFVPGSVTGATGTPPTLTLANPIPADGGTATVTFQVLVGSTAIPNPNPVPNSASTAFTFTVDPADPDGASGTSDSNSVNTPVNGAIVGTVKTVDKVYAKTGDVLTYTLTFRNTGNTSANNVVVTDAVPTGTTFIAGSLTGATGTPPTLTLLNPIPANGVSTVTYQVLVGDTIPDPNPVLNSASSTFTYTVDPADPDGATGTSDSNVVSSQVNTAIVTAEKTVDKTFVDANGVITYTVTLTNTGNVVANNVVLTDAVPAGTTFVAGSLTGATGTPPTLTLLAPLAAGGTAVVTYQVKVGNSVPNPNPVSNTVSAAFSYTMNPADPNGETGTAVGGPVTTQVNTAKLVISKSADKPISYIGDTITYQIAVKNTGNVSADNVVLIDLLPAGVSYVAGSLIVSVPYSGTLASGLALTNSIGAGETVTVSFQATVDAIPNPNPIENTATATYAYTVDPESPDGVTATAVSNIANTIVFRYNFSQQISDLIESVALEQAALAALGDAEGAKIQKMVAMNGVTTQELLCLNKSVSDMMDSLSMLEAVLKQKLSIVDCQISGTAGCM